MVGKQIKWGIFGSGFICHDFCVGLSTLPSSEHTVVHVGARSLERAKTFAETFDIDSYSDSYKKVADDPNVDVIYIGTINTTHKELCMLAMNAGKAVLCEKPITMNTEDLSEVLECAKNNNVFIMEALWTRYFPLWQNLLKDIKSKKYGEPNVVFGQFGFKDLFKVDRVSNPAVGGSVLMDIGIYLLNACDMVFDEFRLKELKAAGHVDEKTGVDRTVCIDVLFEGNKTAQLQANGDHQLSNEIKILFDDHIITVNSPFWCPESITIQCLSSGQTETIKDQLPKGKRDTKFPNSEGLRFEAAHVRECLLQNLVESSIMSRDTSKRIMGYLDDIRKQIGANH